MEPFSFIMLRHLPTVDDENDVYTGASHNPNIAPLDAAKVATICKEISVHLANSKDSRLVVSDNPRGHATFLALRKHGLDVEPPVFATNLNNIQQPEWAGRSQHDVRKTNLYKQWHTMPETVRFPEGESIFQVIDRQIDMIPFLQNDSILVSHTTPMQALICLALNISLSNIWCFKFDHYSFTRVSKNVLCRLNAPTFTDFDVRSLRN